MSLRRVDTAKGDADRPHFRSLLVVREIKKAMKNSDVPSAAELLSGMPPLESAKALLSLFVSNNQQEAKGKRTLAMYDMRTSMEYQCDECLWTSRTKRKRGSHERTDLIWKTLAC